MLLHSFALIKIQLHSGGNIVTGFRSESKTAGVSVSEGAHGGTFGSISVPVGVFEHGQEEFMITRLQPTCVMKWTPPDCAASTDVAMRVMCLLVVLFAMLLMLGVPKDLHGPHRDSHSVGLQRTHWCERPTKSSGFRQSLQTWRHSHRRRDKCAHVFQSEYRNCSTKRGVQKIMNISSICIFIRVSSTARKTFFGADVIICFLKNHFILQFNSMSSLWLRNQGNLLLLFF